MEVWLVKPKVQSFAKSDSGSKGQLGGMKVWTHTSGGKLVRRKINLTCFSETVKYEAARNSSKEDPLVEIKLKSTLSKSSKVEKKRKKEKKEKKTSSSSIDELRRQRLERERREAARVAALRK